MLFRSNFTFDSEGSLVSPDGQFVMGYTETDPLTGEIVTTGQPTKITTPPGVLRPPVASTSFQMISNLDADAIAGDTFTAAVQVYDALGATHIATMTYTNTGPGAWSYDLSVDGGELAGGVLGTPTSLGSGTLSFDSSGILQTVNGAAPADVTIVTPAWKNGAAANTLNWDIVMGKGVAATPALTGFSSPSSTSSISRNGSPASTINNLAIDSAGQIVASFGAGQSVVVGQLALANFNNPQGLVKLGSNLYGASVAAGLPNIGTAGSGGRGTLIGKSLEQSNVDISNEFTDLIVTQRGFQANAKVVTSLFATTPAMYAWAPQPTPTSAPDRVVYQPK